MQNGSGDIAAIRLFVGYEGEIGGIYLVHWEIGHLTVPAPLSRRGDIVLFGERKTQRCQLEMAPGVANAIFDRWGGETPSDIRYKCYWFRIKLRGEVIEEGLFGHMGWCRWRVLVKEFLEVESLDKKP